MGRMIPKVRMKLMVVIRTIPITIIDDIAVIAKLSEYRDLKGILVLKCRKRNKRVLQTPETATIIANNIKLFI